MSYVIYRRNIKTNVRIIVKTKPASLTEKSANHRAFALNQANTERGYVYGYCREAMIGSLGDKLQESAA